LFILAATTPYTEPSRPFATGQKLAEMLGVLRLRLIVKKKLKLVLPMKRVLTVGLKYTGNEIEGVEFENFGLCQPTIDSDRAAFPLYEYDVIVINPKSYSHFLFGTESEFSGSPNELGDLKRQNDRYDLDTAYDSADRQNELEAAIDGGSTVVWCLAEPKRMNFFGYRETSYGYAAQTSVCSAISSASSTSMPR
jgi:hypothetical protein